MYAYLWTQIFLLPKGRSVTNSVAATFKMNENSYRSVLLRCVSVSNAQFIVCCPRNWGKFRNHIFYSVDTNFQWLCLMTWLITSLQSLVLLARCQASEKDDAFLKNRTEGTDSSSNDSHLTFWKCARRMCTRQGYSSSSGATAQRWPGPPHSWGL